MCVDESLDNLVLDLLHQAKELLKRNATIRVWIDVLNEVPNLSRVALKAAHDGFKIFDVNEPRFLFVKQIEYFSKAFNLVLCKCAEALLPLGLEFRLLLAFNICIGELRPVLIH